MQKLDLSNISGRNGKWYIHCGRWFGISSELNIELPWDSAMPLPGMYSRNLKTGVYGKNVYTNVQNTIIHNSPTVETIQVFN